MNNLANIIRLGISFGMIMFYGIVIFNLLVYFNYIKGWYMKIIQIDGKIRNNNIQQIIVDKNDKYGIAMIAYFKNSLNGQNVENLAVKDDKDVTVYYNRLNETYVLQILKFSIDNESIIDNYNNFKEKYDILIKDKISQL